MENKLVVVIMGQSCEKFIDMALESVKDADAIVYCDGGSKRKFWNDISFPVNIEVIENKYNQEDKGMNGKQRNFYLDYVKKNYPKWWCLALNADEIVDDFSKIKEFIQLAAKDKLYSVKMRHLIGDLGHEDATQPIHFVPHRLFHIGNDLHYPEIEHSVLQGKDRETIGMQTTCIWHLAYIPNMWEIKKRYDNNMKKSQMHTKDYLKNWYYSHMFGQYPRNNVNLLELPEILLNKFGIEKDELYFINRKLELKHFLMCKNWLDYIGLSDKRSVLDLGCGLGHYGFVFQEFMDCNYTGIEKSKWAVENCPYKNLEILQMDITKGIVLPDSNYDLVICLDILEHLDYKELDFVLEILPKLGKYFIFSLPFLGDPNLGLDPTHKIKESKEWWKKKLSKYFKISDAPQDWLFAKQILIGGECKQTIIINQFGLLGDILFVIPIVEELQKKQYNVIFPIMPTFLSIAKHFPHINFIDVDKSKIDLYNKRFVKQNNTLIFPIRFSDTSLYKGNRENTMKNKYVMAEKYFNLKFPDKVWSTLKWKRFKNKEQSLFEELGLKEGEKYNLINNNFSENESIDIKVDNEYKNIYVSIKNGYSLLDWSKVIEEAETIHTVSTSITYVIEALKTKAKEFHIYCRPHEPDLKNVMELFKKNWIEHK